MRKYLLVLSLLLLLSTSLGLDMTITNGGDDTSFRLGYVALDYEEEFPLLQILLERLNDPFGNSVDVLDNFFNLYPGLHDAYLNTAAFAPWPAPHTTLFAPPNGEIGLRQDGFFPYTSTGLPGEYLGISFDLPATDLWARFRTHAFNVNTRLSEQYYYPTQTNNGFGWPLYNDASRQQSTRYFEWIAPFHVTAKTVDGYFYYDWLQSRIAWEGYNNFESASYFAPITDIFTEFILSASDPRGIDWLKVYSLIPENNRAGIYSAYLSNQGNLGDSSFTAQIPRDYQWLYLDYLAALIASPSSTRTISATVTPTPQFLRQPSHSATRSPSVTHTAGTRTPTSSHTPLYVSGSNTPTRTPNRSQTNSPTPSQSFVPAASPAASASALGQTATSTTTATPSNTPSPVTPTTSPTVTKTATGTRTAFLTASNTQQPGRNVPSASIAPSPSPAAATFIQPDSSTAVLVQFNVLCIGYCSGLSATQLQLEIARSLNLNTEFIRIVAIHEFFEGDSEITMLICSNDGVDTLLNSIQSGSFTQEYFVSISVESVDWTVRCDMDLYNYLALSSQYIDTASSATSLLPLFVLFFLQLWMLV